MRHEAGTEIHVWFPPTDVTAHVDTRMNIYACITGMCSPLFISSICDFSNNKLSSGTATLDPL